MILFCISTLQAQKTRRYNSNITHEIGVIFGSSSFTTDYGQRYLFQSNVGGNVGLGFGIVHYLGFTDYRYRWNHQTTYFAEHFKIRSEISYHSADLEHFGKWIKTIGGTNGEKLRAMYGSTKTLNFGSQMEYHLININDFGSRRNPYLLFSPYASFGLMVNFYNPTLNTSYGDGDWKNDYNLLFPKWASPEAADDSKGVTLSLTGGLGTRFKLFEYSDLVFEAKWHYFFTDWVDGLNAKDDPANKFNDWLLFIHVGYIYYLD